MDFGLMSFLFSPKRMTESVIPCEREWRDFVRKELPEVHICCFVDFFFLSCFDDFSP